MLNWLQLLNPVQPRHLLPPLGGACAPQPAAQWLAQVLAAAGLRRPPASPGRLTLLAPSDPALQEVAVAPERLAAGELQHWLLRHLTLDDTRSGGLLQMLDGQLLRPGLAAGEWLDAEGRLVRCVGHAGERAGLQVQAVDRMLLPASASLWDRLSGEPGLRRFAAALAHSGLDTVLKCKGPFTVLAPSDQGPGRAADRLGLSPAALWADREQLAGLLARHLLPGRLPSCGLPWGGQLRTLDGQTLSFSPLGLLRSGDLLLPLAPGSDLSCGNGVLHHLDEALLPPLH